MAEYIVVAEYRLPPNADWENPIYDDEYVLSPDERFYDGEIEPDIVAKMMQRGVIVRADGVDWAADKDAPDDDQLEKHGEPEAEPESEDELPADE